MHVPEAPKLPPHSIEAEQSLLGGLLLDNNSWDRIAGLVTEADFYRDDHRHIFRHIARIVEENKPADVVTVAESLEKSGEAERCGGMAYLGEIANNTPSTANIRRYAEIVHERGVLRELIMAADEIAADAFKPAGRDVKTILDNAESRVFRIAEAGGQSRQGLTQISPMLGQAIDRIQALYEAGNAAEVSGTPTGYPDLDELTSGLQAGDMVVVAGRPSMGKTSLALNIAEHVALHHALPVAIFSMEMPGEQLAMRFISSVGRINQQRLRNGRINDEEWSRLTTALTRLHDAPIYIDETPGMTPTELRAAARRLHRQCGRLGLIVIDYIQLMSANREGENRNAEITDITRAIKSLAKQLSVPVIALSQLNRQVDARKDRKPLLSDLRESGAIEQDADLILFLYRDEFYDADSRDKGIAEVIVGKHRNGPTGVVRLAFLGEYTRFENLTRDSYY